MLPDVRRLSSARATSVHNSIARCNYHQCRLRCIRSKHDGSTLCLTRNRTEMVSCLPRSGQIPMNLHGNILEPWTVVKAPDEGHTLHPSKCVFGRKRYLRTPCSIPFSLGVAQLVVAWRTMENSSSLRTAQPRLNDGRGKRRRRRRRRGGERACPSRE